MECANKAVQFYATESDIKKRCNMHILLRLILRYLMNNILVLTKIKKQSRTNKTKPLLDENEINEILEKDKEKVKTY